MKISASFFPITACLRLSALSKLKQFMDLFDHTSQSDDASPGTKAVTSFIITCPRIDIHVPLVSGGDLKLKNEFINDLLLKGAVCYHSNSNPSIGDQELCLQWTLDSLHFIFDSCSNPPTNEDITPSVHAKLTSLRSIVGLSIPFELSDHQIARVVLDLIILDNDVLFDSKSVLMIEYSVISKEVSNSSRRKWTKKYFPFITPLASVKATQDQDSRYASRGGGARGSDPQAMMYSYAYECDRNAFLYIPNIIVDISSNDISFLLGLISSHLKAVNFEHEKSDQSGNTYESRTLQSTDAVAVGIRCDLITLSTHLVFCSTNTYQVTAERHFVYILALDRCWFHSLSSTLHGTLSKNTRILVHDFSFFEGNLTDDEKNLLVIASPTRF